MLLGEFVGELIRAIDIGQKKRDKPKLGIY